MNTATAFDVSSLGNSAWTDNWAHGAGAVHGEILHEESRSVWLVQEAITPEAFEALELPEGFLKTGIGESVADVAYFRRSPGAASGDPLETLEMGGLRFARVAPAHERARTRITLFSRTGSSLQGPVRLGL
ncbi:MAG: hypothetical protein ABR538_04685 [Candidatus Binatia bacterium]